MLGAGEDGQAFVDVAVELGELPRGVAVAEIRAPAAQDAVEVADDPRQGVAHIPTIGRLPDLGPDGVHRAGGRPSLPVVASPPTQGRHLVMVEAEEVESLPALGE